MVQTTRAVVLRAIRHGDRSLVAQVYTEAFGLRSCMVRTGQRGGSRMSAWQPLSRVEIVLPESVEHRMGTVREVRIDRPYLRVPVEPVRGLMVLFTQEVLLRTLREETADARLFGFIEQVLERMDSHPDTAHYPLALLTGLMGALGFSPDPPDTEVSGFDLREGHFFEGTPPHEMCMAPAPTQLLIGLLNDGSKGPGAPIGSSDAGTRRRLLDDLLLYFRLHVDGFGTLRSIGVIRTVLE